MCYVLRRKRTEFFKKAEAGCEDWSTAENRELLRFVFVKVNVKYETENWDYLLICILIILKIIK